ncbi:MAG: J domain-containing protein [Acidimicrobiales bacterium]
MTDPFAVLGIAPSASADEVRAAYRARSMLLHPDLHQGRPEHVRREADRAMTQLTEAYEAALAQRARGGGSAAGRAGGGAAKEPVAYRLGRLAARSRIARDASVAGEQDGRFAYRLGWLVGRRRSK